MDTVITRQAEARFEAGCSGLKLVADNWEAFAARVLAARSAADSLDLMYYLWHDDPSGRLLIGEVVRAADRGVKVRMLLDDINWRSSDAAYLALDGHPNIELRLFNPTANRNGSVLRKLELASRLFAMTRRMHTKAWIADRKVAIVGGRNIGDAYFDAAETNFRDLDLVMLGPAVDQTVAIFEAFWRHPAARPVHELHPRHRQRTGREARRGGTGTIADLLRPVGTRHSITELLAAGDDLHWIPGVRVISDPPDKVLGENSENWLMRQLLPLIEGCRDSLEIVSPYFIPGRSGTAVLSGLVERGVHVDVLTNSLAATDVAAVHGAYAKYRPALLRSGVGLYELQPYGGRSKLTVFGSRGASLHTKAFTVDETAGFVGSFNFDPRSVSLNAEMGVLFEDAGLVARLRRLIRRERSPKTSYRLSLEGGRLRWQGDHDGITRRYASEPEASLSRRLVASVVRWLPIESQL